MKLTTLFAVTMAVYGGVISAAPAKRLPVVGSRFSEWEQIDARAVIEANRCGPNFDNAKCGPASLGPCCSPSGYCGRGPQYCKAPDCLEAYGTCDTDMNPSGPTTTDISRPLLGAVSYTDDIFHCTEPNTYALTYDDGPGPYTSDLLDLLAEHNAKATFFVSGNNNGKGPIDNPAKPWDKLLVRMISEGHQVASHTWTHNDLSKVSSSDRIAQITRNERAIANVLGFFPSYMRPPYSSCTEGSGCRDDMKALGYHIIEFDMDTEDYLNPKVDQIQNAKDNVDRVLGMREDALSIQHDIIEQSAANLTRYALAAGEAKGMRFVTVGECLQDPIENWYRQTDM